MSNQQSLTITIQRVPPSQNVWNSYHWAKKARIKKSWEHELRQYGYLWRGKPATTIIITFYFPDNRRRDKDNYAYFKGILDGLTKSGIIADDSVQDIDVQWEVRIGTGERKTIIEVER